jgi:hypothetical protein
METTFNKSTDTQHKVTVESQLLYAMWTQGRAYAGFEAEFEVKTALVGNGGKVKATCRTEKGKKIDTTEGVILNNRFIGRVVISEKVKPDDYVWLDVELPKHKLSVESNSIPVRPPIEVSSMGWNKTEVRRDEEVELSCVFTNGVEDGDRVNVIIYEHDNDGYHDKVVTIPTEIKNMKVEMKWKFIYQEDTDDIPTDEELQKYGGAYNPPEYFFVVMVENIPVGKNQESGLLEFKDWVEITVREGDEVLADTEVKVVFADGSEKKVTTDSNGAIKLEDIPPGKIKVIVAEDEQLLTDEEKFLEQSIKDEETSDEEEKKEVDVSDEDAGSDAGPSAAPAAENGSGNFDHTYDTEFLEEEQNAPDWDQ